ncbi:MAG: hypothetical protein IJA58_04750 [Lachnospiraceae bacterium]|nr:hypothetical protein [Lachnospiraceae bacterium]
MPKSKRCRCVVKKTGNPINSTHLSDFGQCTDVCATPICADPSELTLMAPVIYDQLGINLCSAVTVPGLDALTTAASASVQVIDITLGADSEITQISGRTNCYQLTLSELTVTFAIRIYDSTGRLLSTLPATATYLPPEAADNFDEETNPSSIEFDIFAPYGISYIGGDTGAPLLNYIGFSSTNSGPAQGLNYTAFAKILNLDVEDSTATIGLTLYVLSLYYTQYLFSGVRRAEIPKVSLIPDEDSLCLNFVEGDLLNLAIKPLELGIPFCEANLKRPCTTCDSCCSALTSVETGGETLPLDDDTEG